MFPTTKKNEKNTDTLPHTINYFFFSIPTSHFFQLVCKPKLEYKILKRKKYVCNQILSSQRICFLTSFPTFHSVSKNKLFVSIKMFSFLIAGFNGESKVYVLFLGGKFGGLLAAYFWFVFDVLSYKGSLFLPVGLSGTTSYFSFDFALYSCIFLLRSLI